MVRLCNLKDKQSVKELFCHCFPGEPDFNDWYFEHEFKVENTLVFEEDGKVTSMLQMLNCQIAKNEKLYNATYIFGAGTHEDYRRKHQMQQLLDESFKLDMQNAKYFSVLIPQEDWLFKFYEKYGYNKQFYLKKDHIVNRKNNYEKQTIHFANCDDIEQLNKIYEQNVMHDFFVKRNKQFWESQIKLVNDTGSGVAVLKDSENIIAYAFVYNSEKELFVQEAFAINDNGTQTLLQNLCNFYNKGELKCMQYTDKVLNKPFAMVKFYKEKIKDFYGYMNLMFN